MWRARAAELWRRRADWALVVAATVGGGWLAGEAGLPSGYMFAAMLVGLCYAIVSPGRLSMPPCRLVFILYIASLYEAIQVDGILVVGFADDTNLLSYNNDIEANYQRLKSA